MKKHLLLILMILLPLAVSAENVEINGVNYKLNFREKSAMVIGSNDNKRYAGEIIIPSSINDSGDDYSVTKIGNSAFADCNELTSVTIPSSVTVIGNTVFKGCTSLASIVVEDGNPNYDSRENCNAIIETTSNKLLYGCNGTVIPNSVRTIGKQAFYGSGITSVIIPDEVTGIEREAFGKCNALSYVYIGRDLTNIGYDVFLECDNPVTVELNNNAIVSKNYDFQESTAESFLLGGHVEELILGEDVTSIGDYAFFRSSITSVKMSNNVTTIGKHAFFESSRLTSIELSENLTHIGEWAFAGCGKLSSITIPQSVKCINLFGFQFCYDLKKVEVNSNEVVSRDGEQFYTLTSCFGNQVEEYVLGEDVRKIAYIAFAESAKLTTVTLPSNLTCVEDSAFRGCSSLKDMYCYAAQVPQTGKEIFYSSNYANATLHVPATAIEAYKSAEQWKNFGNIVALTDEDPKPATTGIAVPAATQIPIVVGRYTIDGKRISEPQRGLNILKMSDGTTRKVLVK